MCWYINQEQYVIMSFLMFYVEDYWKEIRSI